MAAITTEQKKEIRRLTRAANRRLERATEGQRRALEYYVKKSTGEIKFNAITKGLTAQQASAKIETLRRFLTPEGLSTRKGWEKIKADIVSKSNATLTSQGYSLSDEELAEILEQVDTSNNKEYYRAINLVEAKKINTNLKAEKELEKNPEANVSFWEGTKEQIAEAIAQKATYQQALTKALRARKKRG